MATYYEIPLQPGVHQRFSTTLGGIQFNMFIQWREAGLQAWILDLSDANSILLVAGVPLLPGEDLLVQYPDLNFPGQLVVQSDGDTSAPPTFDNLGIGSHLYFIAP